MITYVNKNDLGLTSYHFYYFTENAVINKQVSYRGSPYIPIKN